MKEELQLIQDLMAELQEKMAYGEEDFDERLGRKKPEVEVLKVEGEINPLEEEQDNADFDEEMDLDADDLAPDDLKLKKRLMKLRG